MQNSATESLAERPEKLSTGIKLGFGIADLGGNLFVTVIGFFLLAYLTDSFGLSAGAAGTAIALGRVWDAITDPAVGYLSDRTRTRMGRRRPYMTVGAPLLLLFMILMFTDPGLATSGGRFAYALIMYCLLNTAYTLVNIPYSSLTPELTNDFDERTNLNGFRMSFAVVGTLTGAAITPVLLSSFGGGQTAWTVVGSVMGAIMAITTFITIMSIKEKPATRAPERVNLFRSYWEVVRQKPFFTVLITYSLHMTGVGIVQASLIYFFRNIYQAEDQFGFALLFLLVSCLAMIPVWVKISRRIGKKRSYNTGMAIFAVAVMIFFVVGTRLPIWFAFVTFAVAGIGFSTHYVMPWSLIPDAVEYDFAENGKRREGIFYGMWTFTSKLGSALGLAVTGWVLEIFGYLEPSLFDAPPVQPESALLGIRLLTGPIPAVFFVLGILMLSTYPITQKAYAEIVRKSEARMAEEQQAR